VQLDMERLAAGVPALSNIDVGEWFSGMPEGMRKVLDALAGSFPNLANEIAELQVFVEKTPEAPARWLELVVRGETGLYGDLAGELQTGLDTARFIVEQGLKPYCEACAAILAPQVEEMRWDKGYCPVCGAFPDSTYLRKGKEDFEYLVAHGGQRWLHCSLCSHEWRLRRMVCPFCENEDAESLEYFQPAELEHERIYVCHKCRRYVTCIDVSQLVDVPPGDLLPFELLHMDLIAQQKGYTPMAWNMWNATAG
jgi:FdhE protein